MKENINNFGISLMADSIPELGKSLRARTASFDHEPGSYARFHTSPISKLRNLSPGVYEVETSSGGCFKVILSGKVV